MTLNDWVEVWLTGAAIQATAVLFVLFIAVIALLQSQSLYGDKYIEEDWGLVQFLGGAFLSSPLWFIIWPGLMVWGIVDLVKVRNRVAAKKRNRNG